MTLILPQRIEQRGQRGDHPRQVLWAALAADRTRSPVVRPSFLAEEPLEASRPAARFPLAQAADALRFAEAGGNTGKVLIVP